MRRVLPVNARKIKFYRLAKGMTASELARKIGVSKQSISSYEKGTRFPIGHIEKIAEVLGVAPSDLVDFGD